MYKLSKKSLDRMKGVHPDLVKVVKRAIQLTTVDFTVTEGLRSIDRQRELVKSGASKTMNSRHLTGHAVDLVALNNGQVSWDWPLFFKIADAMKKAAKELNIPLEWGGDWRSFKDGPHFQLPFNKYPKTQKFVAEVDLDPPYTQETEKEAATKAVTSVAGGAATSVVVGYEPVIRGVEALTSQQTELSSGDWLRIGIAVVIVAASIWMAWKKIK